MNGIRDRSTKVQGEDLYQQICETRKSIKDKFKKSHEALVARENILMACVDSIEQECNLKIQLQNELFQYLNDAKSLNNERLKANQLTNTQKQILTFSLVLYFSSTRSN